MKNINLNIFSTYRTQLMGLAALMIIICHISAFHVALPGSLLKVFELGNFGVEIFLLLSGLGCYYSLSNGGGILTFYGRRLKRVYVTYSLVIIPFLIVFLLLKGYSILDCILDLTTLNYWIHHKGAWFISLIVILYLGSPLFYKFIKRSYLDLFFTIAVMILCITLYNILLEEKDNESMLYNIIAALRRAPNFVIGMFIGKYSMASKKVNWAVFCVPVLAFVIFALTTGARYNLSYDSMFTPLVTLVMIYFLEIVNYIRDRLKISLDLFGVLGKMSLESYLTNIYTNTLLTILIPQYLSSDIFEGRYLEYIIIIVFGLSYAYFMNKLIIKIR